jgi:hypothetical protein
MSVAEGGTRVEVVSEESTIKNVALFLVAPFIGLAYVILLPFVAIGVFIWIGCKALAQMKATRLAAAPFAGLAMLALVPFLGMASLAWVGMGGELPHALVAGSSL